ncbi:ATP synthase gamma chain [Buchnera aphidicola (Chaitophorus populicola)]|uniref:ATP synthase F1 subunit gamma n=1 Tax=Buchnera aphidicola TaxID=9 RepID=UPI003464A9B7
MFNKKDIQKKIHSITNTKKITKAMEMISIIKMKKVDKKIKKIFYYFNTLKEIIKKIIYLSQSKKQKNIFTFPKKIKKIAFIVVFTSKGLCGGLNHNLSKKIIPYLNNLSLNKVVYKLIILGKKEINFLNQFQNDIKIYDNNFFKNLNYLHSSKISKILFSDYKFNKFDQILIAFNKSQNKINYKPVIETLLPISLKDNNQINRNSWDYVYESNIDLLLENLCNQFFNIKIYYSILENLLTEYSSRVIAMKNATENSTDLIKELHLIYNKLRQDNITQELTEIISGASAVLMD